LLRASDVLVHPAIHEAFGLVVADAQALGLPAIVTENTGPAEIVENGFTGLVVPPEKLAEAMLAIGRYEGPRRHAVEEFSDNRMRREYRMLYAVLCEVAAPSASESRNSEHAEDENDVSGRD
jgi:glycosyltransferase involved in cell wall biosynthesis